MPAGCMSFTFLQIYLDAKQNFLALLFFWLELNSPPY